MRRTEAMDRHEMRFQIPAQDFEIPQGFQETEYARKWTTTLYLGSPTGDLPQAATVRVRFFSPEQHSDFFMLDPGQDCSLEIKLHSRNADNPRRRKYKMEGKLGEVLTALASRENFDELAGRPLVESQTTFPTGLLTAICNREEIDGFVPLGASHYNRRHATDENTRLTIDSNVSLWRMIPLYGDYVAQRRQNIDGNIVEVKVPFTGDEQNRTEHDSLMDDFLTRQQATPAVSKFERMKSIVHPEQDIRLLTPDIDTTVEGQDWKWYEREIKIDLAADPRDALAAMDSAYPNGVLLGRTIEMNSRQQFLELDEGGICIKTAVDPSKGYVIKYKKPVTTEDGVLIRDEKGFPYSEANLRTAIVEMGGDPELAYPRTSMFDRLRVRRVVATQNGNIFLVIADHCVADDGRKPLDQIEIEHIGYVGEQEVAPETYLRNLAQDFQLTNSLLTEHYTQTGLQPASSTQTKYEWIKNI